MSALHHLAAVICRGRPSFPAHFSATELAQISSWRLRPHLPMKSSHIEVCGQPSEFGNDEPQGLNPALARRGID